MKRVMTEEALPLQWERHRLQGDEAHHLIHVLRTRAGERIELLDSAGHQFVCVVQEVDKNKVELEFLSGMESESEPPYEIHFVQALPKADKLDYILQKGAEMGATHFHFIPFERSIAKVKPDALERKIQRWEKISFSAARQSGRSFLPQIFFHQELKDLLGEIDWEEEILAFVPWEEERVTSIKKALQDYRENRGMPAKIYFFIGPEGGLSIEEIGALESCNIPTVTLGARILRTETAGLAVLQCLCYEFELF